MNTKMAWILIGVVLLPAIALSQGLDNDARLSRDQLATVMLESKSLNRDGYMPGSLGSDLLELNGNPNAAVRQGF